MRLVYFIFLNSFLLCSYTTWGQVINTLSSDKTNIHVHAVDSVTRILLQTKQLKKIEIVADGSINSIMPKTLVGIDLERLTHEEAAKTKIRKDVARLVVGTVQIIKDQFKIRILTWGHDGRLGDGGYIFRYKYLPETMTYELKEIERGIVL
jgi:hypothetical protein